MPDTDDQEFEAAWKLASGDDSAPITPVPANDGNASADAAAEAAAEANGQPGDGAEAADPNRQDGAAVEQPPANTDTTAPDIWADAPEHLKAAHEAAIAKFEHRIKSDEGRVSGFQRRSDELRRQVAVLRTTSEQEDLKTYLDSEEYKKSKDEYGADLGPIFQLIEGLAKNTTTNAQQIGQVTTTAASQIEADVEALLDEVAPDRVDLISDPKFSPWLDTQPAFVKRLAANNWDRVVDPAEIVELCNRFRSAHGIEMPEIASERKDGAATRPTETSRKRELQLEGSKATTSRQQIANPGVEDDDFEGAWKEAAAAKKRA